MAASRFTILMRWIRAFRPGGLILMCAVMGGVSAVHTGCAVQIPPLEKHTVAPPSKTLTTDFFDLAYITGKRVGANLVSAKTLTVYLEGDGHAWASRTRPSVNPTPLYPVGLELAVQHPGPNPWAYVARPCQYVPVASVRNCDPRYWTSARFAPEVIRATSQAIDTLKENLGLQRVELVGFSGGGAVALLVASERSDVLRVITVAGNLDHAAWTRALKVSPLIGSLNPRDFAERLGTIPQIHFFGSDDKVIPTYISEAYFAALGQSHKIQQRVVAGFDHVCCWARDWPALYPVYSEVGF